MLPLGARQHRFICRRKMEDRRKERMPTIKDVAREAGVSIATVSYVLNDKTDAISEDTQQRVWSAVRKTGYIPNVTARNLRSSQSRLIGYAWHEVPAGQVNAVLDRFTYALARSAEAAGYHILTFTYALADQIAVYDELIRTGRVDGFIIGSTVRDDPRIRFLIDAGFPFVSFGRANAAWDFLWVDTDGARGIGDAVDYLVRLGHRKIAMAAWPEESLAGSARLEGYYAGLARAGIAPNPAYCIRGEHSEQSGRDALAALCALPAAERPTAIVAVSDLVAIGIMNEAEQRGLVVGSDLSVIGFDDAPMTQYLRPALTTLEQPIEQIGARLIEMLEAAIRGEPPAERQVLLPPRLIVRASSGPPPKAPR
jgi:DNA-binding LacI/PurR family transcriptional regulator